jgi:hypothetical protein
MATCTPSSSRFVNIFLNQSLCFFYSSFHQPTSTSNSQKSLLLSYGIVTFSNNLSSNDQLECASGPLSDSSTVNLRLNSDLSLISLSHQQQPSNIYSFDDIIRSSSNSHIFRTLSHSTTNIGDNTSRGNIIFFDENFTDQTTTYLLGPPPPPSLPSTDESNLPRLSSSNSTTSVSRSHLPLSEKEKILSNDSYALTEPLSLHNSPLPSVSVLSIKPLLSSEKSINYTDLLIPSNTGDEQQEFNSSDENIDQCNSLLEEKNERSSTILYTDIDFHQTQRRDRIAQFAAISKIEDQSPPFVL